MQRVIGTAQKVFFGSRIQIGADGQIADHENVGREADARVHERMNRDGISYANAMNLVLNEDTDLKRRYASWMPNGGM